MRRAITILCAVVCGFSVLTPTVAGASTTGSLPQAVTCAKKHVARAGDSWWRIAERYKVSLKSVLAANKAKSTTMIRIGDKVCLPGGAAEQSTRKEQPYIQPDRFYSKTKVKAIIKSVFPAKEVVNAYKVAWRESKYLAQAQNLDGCNGGGCYGLFQVHWEVHKKWILNYKGWKVYKWCDVNSKKDLLYAECNAEIALEMFRRVGNRWTPWGGVPNY